MFKKILKDTGSITLGLVGAVAYYGYMYGTALFGTPAWKEAVMQGEIVYAEYISGVHGLNLGEASQIIEAWKASGYKMPA